MFSPIVDNGIAYAIAGGFAGIMSGILGIGGGIVIVPALSYIFMHSPELPDDINMQLAAGTSLAVMVFTALSTVYARQKKESVLWPIYLKLMPGIIVGTVVGVTMAHALPTQWLSILFGVFLLSVGTKMLLTVHEIRPQHKPAEWINQSVALFIGFKSGLLGVGGGIIVIPYLTYCGVEPRKIAAVSALCTLTVAFIGAISFIVLGYHQPALPPLSSGYVYWPAVLLIMIPSMLFANVGTQIAYKMPVLKLKYAFIAVILITATDMLI